MVNGNLVLQATQGPKGEWYSGRVNTASKKTFKYGLIEARIKLSSTAPGLFPAFWALPQSRVYGIWPKSGEIDVYEYQSIWDKNGQKYTPATLHFGARHGGDSLSFASKEFPNSAITDYQVYAVDWRPDTIIFYRNGKVTGQYNKPPGATSNEWPYDQPFNLIANLAIQPEWGTLPNAETKNQFLAIDWIRVSQNPKYN
jgi:beta-glucanase (GH16 family)